jgi:glycerophosphoryl diester phosphodiesterase
MIADLERRELPEHIPTLAEFYDHVGTTHPVSLDVKDPAAFDAVVDAARNAGGVAEENLWLCHWSYEQLRGWREHTSARLVDSTRLSKIKEGTERRANELRNLGIDAVNLRLTDWNGGLVTLFHRYDRIAFGWDAQHHRQIASLIDAGIDGVFSDHSDRLSETINQFFPPAAT